MYTQLRQVKYVLCCYNIRNKSEFMKTGENGPESTERATVKPKHAIPS